MASGFHEQIHGFNGDGDETIDCFARPVVQRQASDLKQEFTPIGDLAINIAISQRRRLAIDGLDRATNGWA